MSGSLFSRTPLDAAAAIAAVSAPGNGGTALFIGSTRAEGEGPGRVVALSYDGYEEMADAVAVALVADARARFGADVALMHRLGEVPAGEASLVVAAGAPHRDAAFAACRFAVEAVKRDLPVWKQEVRADGTRRWRDGVQATILRG
jgi:molybdopterin synthase catalytic subunit